MSNFKQKMEAMLFDYQTTQKTDYRDGEITGKVITKPHKKKAEPVRGKYTPVKYTYTLNDWTDKPVPFSLMHKGRDYGDLSIPQKPYPKYVDTEIEEVIKTRPRLVMTPAVSMDDIKDPRARELLIADMYESTASKGMKEAVRPYLKVIAPRPALPAVANPIKLPRLVDPYVSPEWRMESASWDIQQLRAYCDPTKDFWLRQKLPPCRACDTSNRMNTYALQKCLAEGGRALHKECKTGLN